MTPLSAAEILPPEAFAAIRERLREAVIAHKQQRRVAVGDRVTLLFEDRETLRWQVQEMCRVEGIRDPEAIQQELDVYNELMPGPGELSATLFVEITEAARIRPELDRLVGLDEHVALWIGDEPIRARFDPHQLEEERISAVQYIRFALDPRQVARFSDRSQALRLVIDHPRYAEQATIPEEVRRSLEIDLRGDPRPLLEAEAPSAAPAHPPAGPAPLARRGRAQAWRLAPGHVAVEASGPGAGFAEADPALLADVMTLAQDMARELLRSHGACRVSFDVSEAQEALRCEIRGAVRRPG